VKTIATISRIAGTLKTAESIRAVGKNITGSVFAFILICEREKHVAISEEPKSNK
jgi:hypothetical protein